MLEFINEINIIDIILILTLLWGAWQGYRKGLIKNLIDVAVMVCTFVGGILFGDRLVDYLEMQWNLRSLLTDSISTSLAQLIHLPGVEPGLPLSPLGEASQYLSLLPLPAPAIGFLQAQMQAAPQDILGDAVSSISGFFGFTLANMLLHALVFFVILAAVRILASLIYWILKDVLRIAKSSFDSLAGLLLGVLKTALFLTLILAVLTPILGFQEKAQASHALQQSSIANFLLDLFYKAIGRTTLIPTACSFEPLLPLAQTLLL